MHDDVRAAKPMDQRHLEITSAAVKIDTDVDNSSIGKEEVEQISMRRLLSASTGHSCLAEKM